MGKTMRSLTAPVALMLGGALLVSLMQTHALAADASNDGAEALQQLRKFTSTASVLYVAAHPDDENTQLITYLARGRNYRTAYLSVTRGDGGQNELGPEFGEQLGLIRTQELLAARRLDGGQQFFTSALDFGFSKDYRETLNNWDRTQVVSDIVRVMRRFRPDVVITRFSTEPGNTHGHHTASAVLGLEAFKVVGDPKAFPDQNLPAWQPKRIFMNAGGNAGSVVRIDVNGKDPVTDESFASIANRSRGMHKTQGFGNLAGGGGGGGGQRMETFTLLDGAPAAQDILDGVDTSWKRFPGGEKVDQLAIDLISKFNQQDLSANIPALLEINRAVAALQSDPTIEIKKAELQQLIKRCLGLSIQTTVAQTDAVPGETLQLHHVVTLKSNTPVRWLAAAYPGDNKPSTNAIDLKANEPSTRDVSVTLPATTPLTQPYWLREKTTGGMFKVEEKSLIGNPENPPAFPINMDFDIGGQAFHFADQPLVKGTDSTGAEQLRRLDIIPPASIHFTSAVKLFAPKATQTVSIEITARRANLQGTISLNHPAGWTVTPTSQPIHLSASGDHGTVQFTVAAPQAFGSADFSATLQIGSSISGNDRIDIRYDHIPPQLLQPLAQMRAVCLNLATKGQQIGYLPGAGDSVADALREMGFKVTELTGADLTPEKLSPLDAVVIGVRAMNVRTDLADHMAALFAYVENGGTVIEQYNRPNGIKTQKMAPYDLRVSGDRVTDEKATMTLLVPDHPAFNSPNKIENSDFDGWVQERGIYFPNQWDEHFIPLLACNDANEAPLKGSLLVAKYGKGNFVYTGLVWFRELPAGVPGAYRLFANLLALGK